MKAKSKKKKVKTLQSEIEVLTPSSALEKVPHIKKFPKNILEAMSKKKRYWTLSILAILLIGAIIFLSQTWLVRSLFSSTMTYPKASVLGVIVGDLDKEQLINKLNQLIPEFQTQKVTLVNGADQWVFDFSKLGVSIDVPATAEMVLKLSSFSLTDKYKLLTGGINSAVEPVVVVDSASCFESLSTITIPDTTPKDASIYYDRAIKLTPDEPGKKYSSALTCQDILGQLASGKIETSVSFEITPANISSAELEPKLAEIQSMVGEPLSLTKGSYSKVLTPEQLLALLDITKSDSGVQVGWSSSRLDELINGVASDVNTYSGSPALGGCQRLINLGGNWLDKTATKNFIMGLGAGSNRSYALPVNYYGPTIRNMLPVTAGGRGTVYLTFDDGMIYGNQIMNYAACYGVKVTFFEIGGRVSTDAAALSRAVSEGHAVQSHGYEHAAYDYGSRGYDWQLNDMKQSIDAITAITGVRPTYFRPPGGNRTSITYDAAAANSLKLILWGVSSADTVASFGSSTICANVLAGAFSGASILMHSSKQKTADAVPCIIEGLAARGFSMQALR